MVMHISLLSHKYTKNKKAVYPTGGGGAITSPYYSAPLTLPVINSQYCYFQFFSFLKSITTSSK